VRKISAQVILNIRKPSLVKSPEVKYALEFDFVHSKAAIDRLVIVAPLAYATVRPDQVPAHFGGSGPFIPGPIRLGFSP